MERTIIHSDMNNAYATIEASLNPSLRGKAIAVCGSTEDRHGIVLAKSREAKALGIKTGEVIWQAKNKCPDLIIVPPHYDEYLKYSKAIREIYYSYTNLVEPFGIDEVWLDVTNSLHLFGSGRAIADDIRYRAKKELGITVSIGISFNKVFAKMGSDMKKYDAVTEIPKDRFKEILWQKNVEDILGVGRATKKKLNDMGIFNLGQLAAANPEVLRKKLGVWGVYLHDNANGFDESPVADRDFKDMIKSIGHGTTCTADLYTREEVLHVFMELSLTVSKRLREEHFEATGVQIHVRDKNLMSRDYQGHLNCATMSSVLISECAMKIFNESHNFEVPIRSLTVRAINLVKESNYKQCSMFVDNKRQMTWEKIDKVIYNVRDKYGKDAITFAGIMGDIKVARGKNIISTLPGSRSLN